MKYLPLVWAGLWSSPVRTVLSLLSIAAAFVLFGILHSVSTGFDRIVGTMSDTRLRVVNRSGMTQPLPIALESVIAAMPGVRLVTHYAYMGGHFQEKKNAVPTGALDIDAFATAVPELILPEDQRRRMSSTRDGAVVGEALAAKYGWKIGDRVPITARAWKRRGGDNTWTFEIVGIYRYKDAAQPPNELWVNYSYFDEARESRNGSVMMFIVLPRDASKTSELSQQIDERFANSANETLTQNEKDWLGGKLKQLGNVSFFVSAVTAAVMFTLLSLTANSMAQSVRKRRPQLALLKACGYGDTKVAMLVVAESLLLSVGAALLGLLVASLFIPAVYKRFGMGDAPIPMSIFTLGVLIAAVMAFISALLPAWRAGSLGIAQTMNHK
jgi:putative ABC transport system permease protein